MDESEKDINSPQAVDCSQTQDVSFKDPKMDEGNRSENTGYGVDNDERFQDAKTNKRNDVDNDLSQHADSLPPEISDSNSENSKELNSGEDELSCDKTEEGGTLLSSLQISENVNHDEALVACGSIENNAPEMQELNKSVERDVLNEKSQQVKEETVPTLDSLQPSPTDGSSLRHRINPEPHRAPVTDEDLLREEEMSPRGSKEKRKVALIRKALESNPIDVEALRNLAISPGGLVNKQMRQRVWPLLINVNSSSISPKPSQEEMEAMAQTYNQVVMDVNRSSSRFPPGIDDHVRMSMKDKLVDLIMRVMLHHRQLKYYQGFHDVCITFLLCMDEDLAFLMVDKLAMGYMREYLDETMERTSLLLNYIYPLVRRCNPELHEHMERNDLGTIFALSWVITWFSHVLGDIKRIMRVFDFFLASHRMMPVYLSAAFVLHREPDIYAAGDEMGYIHKCLSTIPNDLPLESLLERAGDLFLQYPPTEISRDPMLIRMNREVYEHFNRIDARNASRRMAQQANDVRSRMFVRATLWTVTAVVGVAVAVIYHSYSGQDWTMVDVWSPFS